MPASSLQALLYSFANSVPTLRRYICDAVTERSDIASKSLRDQFLKPGILANLDLSPEHARKVADVAVAV